MRTDALANWGKLGGQAHTGIVKCDEPIGWPAGTYMHSWRCHTNANQGEAEKTSALLFKELYCHL